ncbi:MAG: MFS transporter [Nocardioidaceae bacterium]
MANLSQSLAVAAVPLALLVDRLSLPVLYAVALVLGAGGTLHDTSYPGFFVRLVPKRQYVAANSLLSTTQSTSNLAGPALGGALIRVLSAPVAMVVDAVSFCFSATMTRTVRLDDETITGARGAPSHSFDGSALVRRT